MMKKNTSDEKGDIIVRGTSSDYASIGKAYACPSNFFSCSMRLIKTDNDYYESQKTLSDMIEKGLLPIGTRFLTQAEGLAIEQIYLKEGKDVRKAEEFKEYFGTKSGWYANEWTLTGLRVPKGWENGKIDTKTRKYSRIVLVDDKECGELQIPAGEGRIIVESDEIFGLPIETRKITYPHNGYYTHWWFNPTPHFDKKSGYYDVAIVRKSGWPDFSGADRCLGISAYCGRNNSLHGDGFRPVLGALPIFDA